MKCNNCNNPLCAPGWFWMGYPFQLEMMPEQRRIFFFFSKIVYLQTILLYCCAEVQAIGPLAFIEGLFLISI